MRLAILIALLAGWPMERERLGARSDHHRMRDREIFMV